MSQIMMNMPASLRAEIKRQAAEALQPPSPITEEDRDEYLASVPPEFQVQATEELNRLVDQEEGRRWAFLQGAVISITRMLQDADRFQKPLMTMDEAAALLSISQKRFWNIVYLERARLGRFPDWIVDGGGTIQRRVVRDGLLSWAKRRGKNVGRRRMASEDR